MRQVKCTLPEGGDIIVRAGAYQRALVCGDVVDLDQVLVQADGGRPVVTLADALGHHAADHFEPCVPVDAEPRRRSRSASPAAAPDQEE